MTFDYFFIYFLSPFIYNYIRDREELAVKCIYMNIWDKIGKEKILNKFLKKNFFYYMLSVKIF